jgi:hypothetical protein
MEQSIKINSQKYNHFQPISGVPLGILRIYEPTSIHAACSDSQKKDSHDGVIPHTPESQENRIVRFQRQSASRRLLKDKRVSGCLRNRLSPTVKILKSIQHGKCHFADLMVCGSVWDCPVCSAKISERRRIELIRATDQYTKANGSILLVTFTYSHKKEDNLKELLAKQSKAFEWFYRHRTYKEIKKRYMKEGRVRALEVNHGKNGWHPHVHELWFIETHLHDYDTLKGEVFALWVKACAKYDLGEPSWEHGVDIRGGDDASNYIAKFGLEDKKTRGWGVEDELTKANAKKGRNGSLSPFELLDGAISGDQQQSDLFVEYSKAFHRKKQLTWSKGLKSIFDLEELTDEEVAHQQDDEAVLLASIEADEWEAVIKMSRPSFDNRSMILALAENGGAEAVKVFIDDLVTRYREYH